MQPPDSDYLATVAVVIPKAAEEAFLEIYEQVRRGPPSSQALRFIAMSELPYAPPPSPSLPPLPSPPLPLQLDPEAVPVGPENNRDSRRCSPVVPRCGRSGGLPLLLLVPPRCGRRARRLSRTLLSLAVARSARRLAEDKDAYVLYTLTILKKFGDSFRAACREKR